MLSDPTALHHRADACRELAAASPPDRKAHWIKEAKRWDALAIKAAKQQHPRKDAAAPAHQRHL